MKRVLSLEETLELIKKWRYDKNQEAFNALVKANKDMVVVIAKKYLPCGLLCGLSFSDLEAEGLIGIMIAVNKFDFEHYGMESFSGYLYKTIKNRIKTLLRLNLKYANIISLDSMECRDNDGEEKLEKPIIGDKQYEIEDSVISKVFSSEIREEVLKVLSFLTEKQREVIMLRYLGGEVISSREVGQILGLMRQTVEQREKTAVKKLRKYKNLSKLKL